MSPEELVEVAIAARAHAYCPYSDFAVGAAVETEAGRVYSGCNVENVSSGLSICGERAAVFAAVSGGERMLRALAVVTADGSMPCGACRQVLAEFAGADLPIYIATPDGAYQTLTLGELLPRPFSSPLVQ
ncbi:MAG TPA: cytidine deaminase [Anaerolineae bacterium]|nr:cytidine deaminase [Anaerolineae bacterium]HOQ98773.1 cytidine deaminase [Anaerolineae bacterium]HPL28747.1 cytidine deaminase [Anaerolineae bacterium]